MRFLIIIAFTVCLMNNRQTTQVLKDDNIQETRAPNFETDNDKSEIERRVEILGDEPLRLGQ